MKKVNKKNLGLGVRALLTPQKVEEVISKEPENFEREYSNQIASLKLSLIERNMEQPRIAFDEDKLTELSQSIKTHGLIQPITVRRMSAESYQIISGERRWRAAQLAELETIPCYIRTAESHEVLELALIENIQRQDLNPIEIATSYQRLIDECDLTQEKLSPRVGKKRSTISNYLSILKLPPQIQTAVKTQEISMGHARELTRVDDVAVQLSFFKQTIEQSLSVRKLEDLVRNFKNGISAKPAAENTYNPEIVAAQNNLKSIFGTKVNLKRNDKGKGQIVINFGNDGELNRILELMDHIKED